MPNHHLRHASDGPTIGLILLPNQQPGVGGIDKPIGVSSYQLTRVGELDEQFAESRKLTKAIRKNLFSQ